MKNPHIERLRRQAKLDHRNARGHFQPGGFAYSHVLVGDSHELTWWEDVDFVLNDYLVAMAFVHPRMQYHEHIKNLVREAVDHLCPDDLFGNAQPSYQSVGRSRKKITGWVTPPQGLNAWMEALLQEEARLAVEADLIITPYIKSQWSPYARVVELCVPMELRQEADVFQLVQLAKRLLKRETTLDQEFPGYAYRREDWLREGCAERMVGDFHAHQIKGDE